MSTSKVDLYLMQIHEGKKQIERKKLEIYQLKEAISSISSVCLGDMVQSSPDPDRFGNIYSKIDEKERSLEKDISAQIELIEEITEKIGHIKSSKLAAVLYAVYIQEKPLKVYAAEAGYSYRYVCKLKGLALQAFEQEILKKPNKDNLKKGG